MSRRHERGALDPEEVLTGRAKVTLVELLDLIHRVNPTGHGRGAREEAQRYAQKSRLQSLLVRRFGEDLAVVPDPDHPGVVSLQVRGRARDGCHAVVAALDEDARAWVGMQIDLAEPPEPAAPVVPAARPSGRGAPPPEAPDEEEDEEATPSALVRRAEEASEAFDYEDARRALERAFSASGGAEGPAEALLRLLVETLGADTEALALLASLSRAAQAAPRVRGLLAIAAARSGDEARAIALARGAQDARAATAYAALAAGALAAGDPARAAAHLDEARRRDATHGALAGLAADVARARAAERSPLEAEITALVAAGRDAEAEAKAGEVLARWPESDAARRAIRAVEERRRRAELQRLAAEQAALAQARAAREAEEVGRVAALLAAPDPREGLLAYLLLDDELRPRARAAAPADPVRWLDGVGRGAPAARVDAVTALRRARAEVARGDGEAALATLGPHLGLLDRVPEAKQVSRDAESLAAEQRAVRAREAVAAARAALSAGDAAEALRSLDAPAVRHLPEAERTAAAALRAEAQARVHQKERVADLGRLRAARKWFEARRVAEELAEDAGGEEKDRWLAERGAIQSALHRELCVTVDDAPAPIEDGDGVMGLFSRWDSQRWLAGDGRTLVLAQSRGRWILVHALDLEERTVKARIALRGPRAMRQIGLYVTDHAAWLVSADGELFALSLGTWEVRAYLPAADVVHPDGMAAWFVIPERENPAPRFLWVQPWAREWLFPTVVTDMALRRVRRDLPQSSHITDLPGSPEPRVVAFRNDALTLYDESGTAIPGGRIAVPGKTPHGAALHPDGRSLVVVVETPGDGSTKDYSWTVVPDGGPPGPLHPVEDVAAGSEIAVARSGDTGVVALLFTATGGARTLLVLAPPSSSPADLAPLYRVPVGEHFYLVQEARGQRLLGVECAMGRATSTPIGRAPPELPGWPHPVELWVDGILDLESCLNYNADDQRTLRELARKYADVAPAVRAQYIRNFQARPAPNPGEGFSMVAALMEGGPALQAEAEALRAWLIERFPDDPEARLQKAAGLARAGQWAEIERLFDASVDTVERSVHFYHLLALARLHAGDPDGARARLSELRARFTVHCFIQPLEDLLTDPEGPPPPPMGPLSLRHLAAAVRAADRCLDAADPGGALAALSPLQYRFHGDLQVLARIAEAHLRIRDGSPRARFKKIHALATFVDAHAVKDPAKRRDLPIPGATWDRAAIDDVGERASQWLEALADERA